MKKDTIKGIIGVACLIVIQILIGYIVLSEAEMQADAYNRNLGTQYTAIDIILGVHKTARDFR